jgi:ubiquinone/menaquinone biosynthesis C-methylase UbiE
MSGTTPPESVSLMRAALAVLLALQWMLDRALSVGYGFVYDYIFERFTPYQNLRREVLALVEATVPPSVGRREVRILDIGCGPGNFTMTLAEAGFSVVGIDRFEAVVEIGREKRRAKRLTNLAFRRADLADGDTFPDGSFDQLVNIHSLYAHPLPDRKLREACRILKPGGYAVFVNHTRRCALWATLRDVRAREGLTAVLRSLVWVVPNSIFEATRQRTGPHYWHEDEFSERLREAGFTVLETRRTFFNQRSVLIRVKKEPRA